MQPYYHRVQYYETDRMGITHHSNYIRWFEEARVAFLDEIDWSYAKLEAQGIISPVVDVTCKFISPTTFDDVVSIQVSVQKFTGVKLIFAYRLINDQTKQLVATGTSSHCFTAQDGKILRLNHSHPEFSDILKKLQVNK